MSLKNKKRKNINEIKPGKIVSFDAYDEGSYRILVQEVNGTKIKGVVVYFDACYPDACYPNSAVPVIEIEEFDLKDAERIVQDSIRVNKPTCSEECYIEMAVDAQKDFLNRMVPLSKSEKHTYQELVIRIEKTDIEHAWVKKGTYCQIDVTNIVGFDKEGEYKNPYVVERTMNANSLEQMEEGYDYYGSLKGVIVPETIIKFQVTYVAEDKKIKQICEVSVPYAIVKNKGINIFPVKLESNYEEKANNVLKFFSLHEDSTRWEEAK